MERHWMLSTDTNEILVLAICSIVNIIAYYWDGFTNIEEDYYEG